MLVPLVCPCLQENIRRSLLCKEIVKSVQTRCIVKGETQKSPLFWRFSGGLGFSQDLMFTRNSTRKPLNLIKSLIFATPLVNPHVFTMHLVCTLLRLFCNFTKRIVPKQLFCKVFFVIILAAMVRSGSQQRIPLNLHLYSFSGYTPLFWVSFSGTIFS